jgi:hypothetical protein
MLQAFQALFQVAHIHVESVETRRQGPLTMLHASMFAMLPLKITHYLMAG